MLSPRVLDTSMIYVHYLFSIHNKLNILFSLWVSTVTLGICFLKYHGAHFCTS